VWGGDKASDGALKRLISEPTLLIEPKGVDAFEVPNMLSIAMASNEQWAVPVGESARCFVVCDVSDARAKDFAYFKALKHQIEHGGAEAFLYAMLNVDLKDWHPREGMPDTQALRDQKAETAHPSVHWLGNILAEGALPFAVRDESGTLKQIVHADDPSLARSQLLWKQAKASATSFDSGRRRSSGSSSRTTASSRTMRLEPSAADTGASRRCWRRATSSASAIRGGRSSMTTSVTGASASVLNRQRFRSALRWRRNEAVTLYAPYPGA